ncbi:MAG TPA: hypothetical protein PLW66_11580 [Saprospiraceae bacterium]|nr:hypothetical protein [Saprospiraceae bacterium]
MKYLYFIGLPLLLGSCDSVTGTSDTCYVSHAREIYACDLDGPATTLSTTLTEEDKPLTIHMMEATSGNYRLNLGAVNGCDGQVEVVISVNGAEIENSVQQTLPKTLSFAVQGIHPVTIRLRPRSLDDSCLCPDPDLGGTSGAFSVDVLIKKQ